ncbi:MAG TPA: M6 family metalloprotease domain-containing protein [Longimicrobiales bacterium]|jgi:M6 family metalloprotease-like protein
MIEPSRVRWVCLAVALLAPAGVSAQDVLVQGRDAGVQPPAWVREALAADPNAFEFDRAWIQKVEGVLERRRAVAPALGPSLLASDLASASAAVTGTLQVPVVLALYSDVTAPYAPATYDTRLFGDGGGIVSISELYTEMSGGLFTVDGAVTAWAGLPTTAENYEGSGANNRFGMVHHFLRNALDEADPSFDFGQFDNDGPDGVPNSGDDDGYVDVAAFLYATPAMSCGGSAKGIWPHRWTYAAAKATSSVGGDGVYQSYGTNDPAANGGFIQVHDYIIQSGLDCDGSTIMGSGTMSHELGHALALPDLYDTSGLSEGIGHWGLMGSGNWNVQTSPAHMGAWSKETLGWVDVTTISTAQTVVLEPVQTAREVIRVDLPNSPEYFLLSNRQAIGSDEYVHAPGLLVWHIDPTVVGAGNTANADRLHKKVDLEEADGNNDLDHKVNRGDAGDAFPQPGVTEFSGGTRPRALPYAGGPCTPAIRNIVAGPGTSVTFDFIPEELWVLWGDVNRSGILGLIDAAEAYWYSLGWRDADTQRFLSVADVDGDGDVDARDGLIIDSHLAGVSTADFRVGQEEASVCADLPPLPVIDLAITDRARGGG